ncbi:MAG: heparinase II/III family protein [Lentisphaerae bacterium]|nr:heparinase II/III family protein [Lentisphaerota bacterium]
MHTRSRGLLAGIDIETVKDKVSREPGRSLFARIQSDFSFVAETMRRKNYRNCVGNCGSAYNTPMEMEAGFIHRLTGGADALDYVHRMIDILDDNWETNVPNWHVNKGGTLTPYFPQAMVCLAADMCRDSLDPRRADTLLRLVREYFIDDNVFESVTFSYPFGQNIPITRNIASAVCALVFGKESGHPEWERTVDWGRDTCQGYLRHTMDASGYSYEGVGYGYITSVYWIYIFAQLLFQNGRENLFASHPLLGRIPDAVFQIVFPDLTSMAQTSDLTVPEDLPWLCLTARHYGRPQDMDLWHRYCHDSRNQNVQNQDLRLWHVWRGNLLSLIWLDDRIQPLAIEKSALPTAAVAAGTEMANFRTSWGPDAVYLNFLGQGRSIRQLVHLHADGSHFSLFAHGDSLAVDGGYWNDLEDQHNVILVDGRLARQAGKPAATLERAGKLQDFQRDDIVDYVMADVSGIKECRWAHRHLMFVRLGGDDACIVLLDHINPDDSRHTFWWQLHAHPASDIRITGPNTATVEKTHARLDVTFVIPHPGDFPTDPHRLALRTDEVFMPNIAEADKPKVKAEARQTEINDLGNSSLWRPRLVAELFGWNCMMMTILVPRRTGAPPLKVTPVPERRILRAEVESAGFKDTIVGALDHAYIELKDLQGRTGLGLLREDRQGRLLHRWTVDGQPLFRR